MIDYPEDQQLREQASRHDLHLQESRRTAASWMRAASIDLKLRSTLMGHATIASTDGGRGSITDDRYTHLMPGDIEKAGKALASYLRKQTKNPARDSWVLDEGAPASPWGRMLPCLRYRTEERKRDITD
jgi:hypothetical protein